MRSLVSLVSAAALLLVAFPCRAGDAGDGVYGRFEGDLDLRLGAGVGLAKGGPSLVANVSALYMSTAGLYVHYADALGGDGPAVIRSISAGVVIEPLFLGRYATNLEQGPARLDLLLDSLSLQMGAFWDMPRGGSFPRDPGLEFAIGFGVPFFAQVSGPVLGVRGALRYSAPALAGEAGGNILDKGALLSIMLSWRQVLPVNIVDAGDRALR